MRKIICCAVVLISLTKALLAQPYTVENGKTRHRFAQLNVGLDTRVFLSDGSQTHFVNSEGLLESDALENHTEARIIIGGTHFWGHADFYIGIPVVSFDKNGFQTGAETGAKYFPWRIERNKVRPFVGMSMLPVSYKQGEGTTMKRFKYPIMGGVVYNNKNHLLELSGGYNYNNSGNYYITENQKVDLKTQPFWISLGYKFMIETTLSAEKDWQSGRTKLLTDTLSRRKKLNGLTLAIGPSAAFYLKESVHNEQVAPYADQHKSADIFPEFALGYYFHKPDIHFGLAYRNIKSELKAFSFSQKASRQAYTLEAYKFFADYHGFAVFAGPALSYEQLEVTETNKQLPDKGFFNGFKPGLTFGWDIRPNRLQSWYLRTNLRYFPNLNVEMSDGKNVALDQLEFNFIQLVVFPGRMF